MTTPIRARKKPIEIEAIHVSGKEAAVAASEWVDPAGLSVALVSLNNDGDDGLVIKTLEGWMHAGIGDYVIKGVQGEFYPCKGDIFAQTYDIVGADDAAQ